MMHTKKTGVKKTVQAAPIRLEFFDGETIAACDAATGMCTLPDPDVQVHATGRRGPEGNGPSRSGNA